MTPFKLFHRSNISLLFIRINYELAQRIMNEMEQKTIEFSIMATQTSLDFDHSISGSHNQQISGDCFEIHEISLITGKINETQRLF